MAPSMGEGQPSPPLGAYPQLLLWGHVGNAPNRNRISMTNKIVPKFMRVLLIWKIEYWTGVPFAMGCNPTSDAPGLRMKSFHAKP
jgi:hypothetical protein